jgi:hypothetical protein
VLVDSRLLRQRRLETFLNFPRGGLEVCGAVCPLVSLDNRADQRALADMRMRSARRHCWDALQGRRMDD